MSTWVILSWVFVAILTAINIVIFVKLKDASEQMMKMAGGRGGGGGAQQAQLQQAMEMLRNMQKK
jgi:hypothetical protein